MPDQDKPHSKRGSLADFVARIEAADNPEQELLNHTIERIQARDPELAEAVRYCAIPRRFDARIIGILRGTPEDHETNERLLTGLLALSFVLPRKDSGYVYHDNMRDTVLEHWRSDEANRAQFDQFNQRLVAFYDTQREEAERAERDLERVARVVQRANPARYVQLASAVETRLVTSLLEALYHETFRSVAAGYAYFERCCLVYEQRGRLTVCESLLHAIRSYIEHAPAEPEREPKSKWLRYWAGRLARQSLRDDEALETLSELLPQTGEDVKLKLWVLSDLGITFQQQFKLGRAREMYEAELTLHKDSGGDLYNLPVSYSHLGNLCWSLGELEEATDFYQKTLDSAREQGNLSLQAVAHTDLSGVLRDRGRWVEAFDVALEALHFVHSQTTPEGSIYRAVVSRFITLVAHRDPQVLDTLKEELEVLLGAVGDPLQTLGARQTYADLLRESGQLRRAEQAYSDLLRDADGYLDTSIGTSILLNVGILRESEGELQRAIDIYSQIVERRSSGTATRWDFAAALSNRGFKRTECSRLQEAEVDLRTATSEWKEIGHEGLVALLRVSRANVLRLQGRQSQAQRLLDEVRSSLPSMLPVYVADYHQVQGQVYKDQARWMEACEHYQQAVHISYALDQTHITARRLGDLAVIAAARGRWEEAANYTAEANKLWEDLSALDRYRPSQEAIRADNENARGVRHFFMTTNNRREDLMQARDLFQSASERVPDNFWYRLNVAYSCAALGEWDEAAHSAEMALERGPEWLRSTSLRQRLAQFRSQSW